MTTKRSGQQASTNGQLYNPELLPAFDETDPETDPRFRIETPDMYFAFSGPSKDLERLERMLSSAAFHGFGLRGYREEHRETTSEQEAIDEHLKREIGRED